MTARNTVRSGVLVDPEWVLQQLGQPGLVLLEVDDQPVYQLGHPPGARLLDWAQDPSKRIDAASLRPGCEGKANASSATPPTMRASPTRIQARKVRSLASVNRGLGSKPREYTHFENLVLVIGSWLAGQRARTIGLLHSAVARCQRIGASAWSPSCPRQAAR
jgi:hypothetical protein